MTDKDLIAAIRKIIRSRPNADSVAAADLARYDAIVGLLRRHGNGDERQAYAGSNEAPRLTLDPEPADATRDA